MEFLFNGNGKYRVFVILELGVLLVSKIGGLEYWL